MLEKGDSPSKEESAKGSLKRISKEKMNKFMMEARNKYP